MYVIYSTDNCGYCTKAKDLLERNSVDYTVVDVSEDVEAQAMFREKALRSVPQIFMTDDDEPRTRLHIGGFDDLAKFLQV